MAITSTILKPEHFDLARRLQDLEFREGLHSKFHRLSDLSMSKGALAYKQQEEKIMAEIFLECGRNSSLLVPWFFPKYLKKKPMYMTDRPFNMVLLYILVYHMLVLRGSRQIGKEQPYSEPVITPTGWTTMGELKVGDLVFGSDGRPCTVTQIFEQGIKDTYRVTFTDDTWTRCGLEHLWKVRTSGTKHWTVRSLKEIRALRGGDTPDSDAAVRIPLTAPVEFPAVEHAISPYGIGALIGDGGLTDCGVRFTTSDPEILKWLLWGNPFQAFPVSNDPYGYHIQGTRRGVRSNLQEELRRLGLSGKGSSDKRIPREYLFDSVKNRWDLLRGLMDTDGSIYGKCQVEYCTTSAGLCEDLVCLVESLGGKTRVTKKKSGYRKADGSFRECKDAYRIFVTQLQENPFRLKRKADKFYQIRYKPTKIMRSIVKEGREKSRCIMVDSPDNTYLTRSFIVTHNSTSLAVRQRINAHLYDGFTSLYMAPHNNPLETYCRKFLDVERSFRYPMPQNSSFKQNLQYKEYPNGSKVEMVRVQTSATPVRGKTYEEFLGDEMQIFDPGLETEVLEVLNDSKIKSIVYAGTSTTTETLLEQRYQDGTQGVWHVLLDNGQTVDCSNPEQVMPYIGEYFMQDPKTGQRIDPLRGFYVYNNPAAFQQQILSVHIPQIINPDKANDPLEWNGIYKTMLRDPKKMIQEKLGIPVAEANQEVSEKDLKRICVIPDGPEERKAKCRKGYYRLITSGWDWGGSDYNPLVKTKVSTTCHVILGVSPDDKVHILHMRRHAGKDYKTIMNLIVADHCAHSAGGMASDFGGGTHYHALLRSHPHLNPERHVIFDYSSPESAICAPSKTSALDNMLMLNRTESITALYLAIVMDDPLLLAPSWLESEDYLRDFLHMNRVLVDSERGNKGRRFVYHRHPSKSDDVVHATNMAYSLLRLANQQLLIEDPAARTLVRNAIYGTSAGNIKSLNPFARALSNYARSSQDHD